MTDLECCLRNTTAMLNTAIRLGRAAEFPLQDIDLWVGQVLQNMAYLSDAPDPIYGVPKLIPEGR